VLRFLYRSRAYRLCRRGRAGFATGIGAKIWRKTKFSFLALQAIEIKRNGQSNPWKCLENEARNLEMFGVDLERLASPKIRQRTNRVFSSAFLLPIPWAARAVRAETV
jgi:hypothetical protein